MKDDDSEDLLEDRIECILGGYLDLQSLLKYYLLRCKTLNQNASHKATKNKNREDVRRILRKITYFITSSFFCSVNISSRKRAASIKSISLAAFSISFFVAAIFFSTCGMVP